MASSEAGAAAGEGRRLEEMESEMDRIKARLKMYEDPPPPAAMDVRVDGYAWHGSALAKHCRYKIRRTWEGQSLVVYRRFSDFVLLYAKLVREFPGAVVPNHPEKKMIYQGALAGDALAAERAQWFQAFLHSLVEHPRLATSPWLRDFLQMATEDWQTRCEQDASSPEADARAGANGNASAANGVRLSPLSEVATTGVLESSAQASLHQLQQLAPDVSSFKSMVSGWPTVLGQPEDMSEGDEGSSVYSVLDTSSKSSRGGPPGHTVDSQYVKLCWSDKPLRASVLPLTAALPLIAVASSNSTSKTPKELRFQIEAQDGRLRAVERLARASLDHVQRSSELGTCLQDLSVAAKDLGAAERTGAPARDAKSASAGGSPVACVLEALAGGMQALSEAYASDAARFRLTEAIEPVLATTLVMQGADRAYQRLLRARRQKNVADPALDRADDSPLATEEEALAGDLQSHSEHHEFCLASAMEALAQAEIARAQENQQRLAKLLSALQMADPDADWKAAAIESNARTGVGRPQQPTEQQPMERLITPK
ncbi:Sorting nexin-4 [Hondaea fermentalgiana]|uniref:Sorting nexin-4 n=1 Tax=Hondaea fermentalgiana TaxID=2315210 RepID=A0A2R5GTQ2_9STRA|nr:Sorting nexin-4 [Hondaea fermentalgiana]|eukprot:GBG34257.1 Sorting nexin-4 [Hondaea fermentalgiana]